MSERGCTGQGGSRRRGPTELRGLDDRVLLAEARDGDEAAYGELWRRHRSAAMAAARGTTSRIDPEDLVSEASAIVFETIRRGAGPEQDFRPYLFAVVRNLARRQGANLREFTVETMPEVELDDVLDDRVGALDRSCILTAFQSLPPRWREVLWYTEVEGLAPNEVGPIVGLRPNATAALAYRAREGLRRAWLQAHIATAIGSTECRWTLEHLGEHARDGLRSRAASRMDSHLATCRSCRDVALEVRQLEHCLASVLLVAALGTTGGAWFAAAGGGAVVTAVAGGAAATGAAGGATAAGSAGSGVAIAALTAVAAVLATVGVAMPTIATVPHAETSVAMGLGPDALRIDSVDGAVGSTADAPAPGTGAPDPGTPGAAGAPVVVDGGDAGSAIGGPALVGGIVSGIPAVVDGTTGALTGTVDGVVEGVGGISSELTGGAVELDGSLDVGTFADPGLGLDIGVDAVGILGVDLDLQLDGTGIGVGLGVGLLGGGSP